MPAEPASGEKWILEQVLECLCSPPQHQLWQGLPCTDAKRHQLLSACLIQDLLLPTQAVGLPQAPCSMGGGKLVESLGYYSHIDFSLLLQPGPQRPSPRSRLPIRKRAAWHLTYSYE